MMCAFCTYIVYTGPESPAVLKHHWQWRVHHGFFHQSSKRPISTANCMFHETKALPPPPSSLPDHCERPKGNSVHYFVSGSPFRSCITMWRQTGSHPREVGWETERQLADFLTACLSEQGVCLFFILLSQMSSSHQTLKTNWNLAKSLELSNQTCMYTGTPSQSFLDNIPCR